MASGHTKTTIQEVILPRRIYSGRATVATAGTAIALATSQSLSSGALIKALASNTGIIYVGGSDIDSSGYELAAGESAFVAIANLADACIDASVNGEGACYLAS